MKRTILMCLLASFLAVSCATTQDVQNLQYNMERKDKRLQQRMETLSSSLESTKDELDQKIESASGPVRSRQANLWAEIEALRNQNAELLGTVEQLRMQMAELTESQTGRTDTVEELERRTENLDSELQRIVSRLGLEDGKPAPETEDDDQVRADPAEALYNNALAAFRNREYDQARRLWQEFVSTFPDHKLVANAVFWTGESYYQLNDFGQAILSYQEVIEKHPKSNKHSAALLKQGISFMKLDKEKPGKLLLQELVNKFPDSAEAKRAKELLQN